MEKIKVYISTPTIYVLLVYHVQTRSSLNPNQESPSLLWLAAPYTYWRYLDLALLEIRLVFVCARCGRCVTMNANGSDERFHFTGSFTRMYMTSNI